MDFYYITDYSIDLCVQHMKYNTANDTFIYVWEQKEDYYLITFVEYKNGLRSLVNSPKPTFKVEFTDLGKQTAIKLSFLNDIWQPVLAVRDSDIDLFWEKKLRAKKGTMNKA